MFYCGIQNKTLDLEDLYEIYKMFEVDSITSKLNTASFSWTISLEEGRITWENNNRNELINKTSGVLTYVNNNYNWFQNFPESLKNNGHVKVQKDDTGTEYFQNDQYKLALSQTLDQTGIYFVINLMELDQ